MQLPADIQKRIESAFISPAEKQDVIDLLLSLWETPLNIGPEQLARCILFLSAGSYPELKKIFDNNFSGDPRDLIMIAEAKAGNPGHYFLEPLPDL